MKKIFRYSCHRRWLGQYSLRLRRRAPLRLVQNRFHAGGCAQMGPFSEWISRATGFFVTSEEEPTVESFSICKRTSTFRSLTDFQGAPTTFCLLPEMNKIYVSCAAPVRRVPRRCSSTAITVAPGRRRAERCDRLPEPCSSARVPAIRWRSPTGLRVSAHRPRPAGGRRRARWAGSGWRLNRSLGAARPGGVLMFWFADSMYLVRHRGRHVRGRRAGSTPAGGERCWRSPPRAWLQGAAAGAPRSSPRDDSLRLIAAAAGRPARSGRRVAGLRLHGASSTRLAVALAARDAWSR